MQSITTTRPPNRPLVSAEDDPLFSADDAAHPSGVVAQRRAEITVGEVEEIYRRSEAARGRPAVPSDIPDVQIFGAVFKMNVQTDSKGAVLVAYTRDAETGRIGRSFIRFDLAGVNYIRRRLGAL
ncbi:hypothetical protein [Streptomyces scabiei]|uniref:hypothetical protein n=1 Tax=Streptomyces scabiei TaxID=1930 RepID=UPI0029A9E4D6|nr:hypothetical protein [Streptomyces scabiei]MDX2802311.1 hypothetical protein [Streptomyces scabiei]MDX3277252.1 hypothetical protein [Streptomyces scabiei]